MAALWFIVAQSQQHTWGELMTPREWIFATACVIILGLGSRGVWNWARELTDVRSQLSREIDGRKDDRVRFEEELARARAEIELQRRERDEYRDLFIRQSGVTTEVLPRIARKLTEGHNAS